MESIDLPTNIQHNGVIYCPVKMPRSLNIKEPAGPPGEQRRTLRLVHDLVEAIRGVPTAHAELVSYEANDGALTHDAELIARVADKSFSVFVEVKAEIYPRDAREQISRWSSSNEHRRHCYNGPIIFLVAADLISDGAKKMLVSEGIGYFANGGSLYLPAPGAFIFIDRPAPARANRAISSLFTGARAQVLHALLLQPQAWHSVLHLAQQSGASPGTVSNLMKQLEQLEWVRTEGQGPFKTRRLVDPGTLLTSWAAAVAEKPTSIRRYFVPGAKAPDLPPRITSALHNFPGSYEVTAEAAAQHYAPFLTTFAITTVRVLPDIVDQLVRNLGAKQVIQGANLHVIDAESPKDFLLNDDDNNSYATPVRTYLDLVNSPGRGKDAAEHLREQILKF